LKRFAPGKQSAFRHHHMDSVTSLRAGRCFFFALYAFFAVNFSTTPTCLRWAPLFKRKLSFFAASREAKMSRFAALTTAYALRLRGEMNVVAFIA